MSSIGTDNAWTISMADEFGHMFAKSFADLREDHVARAVRQVQQQVDDFHRDRYVIVVPGESVRSICRSRSGIDNPEPLPKGAAGTSWEGLAVFAFPRRSSLDMNRPRIERRDVVWPTWCPAGCFEAPRTDGGHIVIDASAISSVTALRAGPHKGCAVFWMNTAENHSVRLDYHEAIKLWREHKQ